MRVKREKGGVECASAVRDTTIIANTLGLRALAYALSFLQLMRMLGCHSAAFWELYSTEVSNFILFYIEIPNDYNFLHK